MTRRLILIMAALLTVLGISPAAAIDCSRASTAVERAICADTGLRKLDEDFNRGYSSLLDVVDAEQRRDLVADEKKWLGERDALCTAKPAPELADCVRRAMGRRQLELEKRYSSEGRFGELLLGEAGQTLKVGHERLDVTVKRRICCN